MSAEGFAVLADRLEVVNFSARETVYEADSVANDVYFPIDCVISNATSMSSGPAVQTLTIGHEGMCGVHTALGSSDVLGRWFCQIPGRAYRIDTASFLAHYASDERLRTILSRYVAALIDVLSQSMACNRLHMVNERCARWLLTTHDRVKSSDFPLTHEALATLLGVRRAGVSIAAAGLQAAGFIRYKRGKFHVSDAAGLKTAACECYAVDRRIYDRWAVGL